VLGGGLLERARSTTLALLGATTAVGLAMVALALNQSWPLIPDSPLPVTPPRHEAIGKATVAAQAIADAPGAGLVRLDGPTRRDSRRAASSGGAQSPESGFAPSASAELVVAPSAPAKPQGDGPRDDDDPSPAPSPGGKPPQAPAAPVLASDPAQPEPTPQAPPAVESTPPPVSAEAPADSSDDDDWDDDHGWDDDDHDWDDRDWDDDDWDGHGRGRHGSRGHHDD